MFSQFWRLEVQDQGAGRFGSFEDSLPGLQMAVLSHDPHSLGLGRGGERERRSSLVSLPIRALILSEQTPLHDLI